jgi:hypothetical protein
MAKEEVPIFPSRIKLWLFSLKPLFHQCISLMSIGILEIQNNTVPMVVIIKRNQW